VASAIDKLKQKAAAKRVRQVAEKNAGLATKGGESEY
jgi:hypothetical protein